MYEKLVLSAGGSKGLNILGGLDYIYTFHDKLENIKEYWGTSVGSVISLLLLIGFTPFEIFHKFYIFEKFLEPKLGFDNFGLCNIEDFGNLLKQIVIEKIGYNPTFGDLYRDFNKKLFIMGTNVDLAEGVLFNTETHDSMFVIDAIEISCDLPLIFTRKVYQGHTYTDGALINDYPIDLADDFESKVLGIYIQQKVNPTTYLHWIYKLIYIPMQELHRKRISEISDKCTSIEIECEGDSTDLLQLYPSKKVQIQMFCDGYTQVERYFWQLDYTI